jgi:hypothetical protein
VIAALAVQLRPGPSHGPVTPVATSPTWVAPTGPSASGGGEPPALEMPAPPTVQPGATTTGFSDFVRPGDLGPGWTLDGPPVTSRYQVLVPYCAGDPVPDLGIRKHRMQMFARSVDEGDGVETARQYVLPLAAAQTATMRGRLAEIAAGGPCRLSTVRDLRQEVVAAGDGVLVTSTVLATGQLANVTAYATTPAGYVILMVGSLDDRPLPGQAAWAAGFARTALQRLTGHAPAEVRVRDAFRAPSTVLPAGPDRRLLQRADLGPVGHWTRPVVSRDRIVVTTARLPVCLTPGIRLPLRAPIGPEVRVTGSLVQEYLGWTGTGPDVARENRWTTIESVATVEAADLPRARAALAAASRCRSLPPVTGLTPLSPSAVAPDRLVAVRTTTGGLLVEGTAWALSGDTLVTLSTQVFDREGSAGTAHTPVPASWLDEVLRTAVRRATS